MSLTSSPLPSRVRSSSTTTRPPSPSRSMLTSATVSHVPIEEADGWRWWEPVRLHPGPRWFYGVRGVQVRPATHPDPATVDVDLRPLVALLHRAGLPTLPSCGGHFASLESVRESYRALQLDAAWITGHGLTVRCSETGALTVLRAPGWRLPPFRAWAAPVIAGNGHGRIGIVVPRHIAQRWASVIAASSPAVRVLGHPQGSAMVLDVRVQTRTPARQGAAWRAVTAAVGRLLA
jgi:hypothetical protein